VPDLATVKQALNSLSDSADTEKLKGMEATILFNVPGDEGGQWTVIVNHGQLNVEEGGTEAPTITVEATAQDLRALVKGDLKPMAAFMQGRLRVKGDISIAMQLQKLFS
jgi:putative sterol carrier protein